MAYQFTTIDNTIDTSFNRVEGVNDAGKIGGFTGDGFPGNLYTSYQANAYGGVAFLPVATPAFAQTAIGAFSNTGLAVGRVLDSAGNTFGAIDLNGSITAITDPGTPASGTRTSYFNGVNDLGIAVGAYRDANNAQHGRIYNTATGASTDVTEAGATGTVLNGIDNAGVVVGTVFVAGTSSGFVYADGTFTLLNLPLGQHASSALGINNEGQVVGQYIDGSGTGHGYIYSIATNSFVTVDDPFGAAATAAYGINDQGQVVGSYVDAGGARHGFIANPQGGISAIHNPTAGTELVVAPGSAGLHAGGDHAVTIVDRNQGLPGVTLIANDGNDLLVSITGDDTLVGGIGNDTFFTGTGTTAVQLGGGRNIAVTQGTSTITATTGDDTIAAGSAFGGGNVVAYGGTAGKLLVVTGGPDATLVGGAGAMVAFAGAGRVYAFGGTGKTTFIGGGAASSFIGGDGEATVYAGTGGGVFTGGHGHGVFVSNGHTTITAGLGSSQIYAGNGDVVSLVGGASNVLAGQTGNVTLVGGQSTGNNLFVLGDGQDVASGGRGADIFYLGAGFGQLTSGVGPDTYAANFNVGGLDIIHGFRVGFDHLVLNGFNKFEARTDLATQLNSGGSTTLNLTDGTKLTFEGVASMGSNVFG